MIVLGIETSCDESSASLVRDGTQMLSNIVASQVDLHARYGGVVPEIAARAHVEAMAPVVEEALRPLGGKPDAVAVTAGPGLVGSLIVGVCAAKALAWAWDVPLVAVNHVEAHAFAPLLEGMPLEYPFLALLVSGGHTLLARVESFESIEVIGQTLDDALGEAYDKVAKFLGLGYPGGPVIDRLSKEGNERAVRFPRAMMGSGDHNFSMSGLKTAVIRHIEADAAQGKRHTDADLSASFQAAALEVVVTKTVNAALELGLSRVVAGGGVACNSELRSRLERECEENGLGLTLASPGLCTDNAAMVAALGYLRYKGGYRSGLDLDVYPKLSPGQPIPGETKDRKGATG